MYNNYTFKEHRLMQSWCSGCWIPQLSTIFILKITVMESKATWNSSKKYINIVQHALKNVRQSVIMWTQAEVKQLKRAQILYLWNTDKPWCLHSVLHLWNLLDTTLQVLQLENVNTLNSMFYRANDVIILWQHYLEIYMITIFVTDDKLIMTSSTAMVNLKDNVMKTAEWTLTSAHRLTLDSWTFWRMMSCSSSPISNTSERWSDSKLRFFLKAAETWINMLETLSFLLLVSVWNKNWTENQIFTKIPLQNHWNYFIKYLVQLEPPPAPEQLGTQYLGKRDIKEATILSIEWSEWMQYHRRISVHSVTGLWCLIRFVPRASAQFLTASSQQITLSMCHNQCY